MKRLKRIAAFLLAALLLSLALCGCSSQKKQEQKVIGTCAGYDVLYEELRYVTLTYKDLFASTYGEHIWDTPESAEKYRQELEETVWAMMLNNYAVLAACQYYMPEESLKSDAIKDAVDGEVEDAIEEYGGKSAFQKAMAEMHMTENLLRFCLSVAELENELLYVLTDDLGVIENDTNNFADWLEDGNCVYVQHVFIRNDPDDDPAENLALAEEVRRQLILGADIGSFINNSSVNEDTSNTAPYFLVRDVYMKELEEAALALGEVGDVSRVADSGEGYYIFQQVKYQTADLLAQISSLMTSWQWAKLENIVETYKEGLSIELNEYGRSLDLLAIE